MQTRKQISRKRDEDDFEAATKVQWSDLSERDKFFWLLFQQGIPAI